MEFVLCVSVYWYENIMVYKNVCRYIEVIVVSLCKSIYIYINRKANKTKI